MEVQETEQKPEAKKSWNPLRLRGGIGPCCAMIDACVSAQTFIRILSVMFMQLMTTFQLCCCALEDLCCCGVSCRSIYRRTWITLTIYSWQTCARQIAPPVGWRHSFLSLDRSLVPQQYMQLLRTRAAQRCTHQSSRRSLTSDVIPLHVPGSVLCSRGEDQRTEVVFIVYDLWPHNTGILATLSQVDAPGQMLRDLTQGFSSRRLPAGIPLKRSLERHSLSH